MEISIFLVTMGIFIAFVLFGSGVIVGGMDKTKCDGCHNVQPGSNSLSEHHTDMADRDITQEEIELVLLNYRVGASQIERAVIDYLIDTVCTDDKEQLIYKMAKQMGVKIK